MRWLLREQHFDIAFQRYATMASNKTSSGITAFVKEYDPHAFARLSQEETENSLVRSARVENRDGKEISIDSDKTCTEKRRI